MFPIRLLSIILLTCVGCSITDISFWTAYPFAEGACAIEEIKGVPYRSEADADPVRHRLDLFLPKGKKDYPIVVFVHGGAWMMGDNRCCGLYSSVGQFLASQGIGVVLPNYRLSPGVKHPEHIKDVARAVAWTHDNIARYGGDPERIILLGHSAGGHLVSLLATDESYLKAEGLKTTDIKGVIAVSGVYNLPPGPLEGTFGGTGPISLHVDQMLPLRADGSTPPSTSAPALPAKLDVFAPVFGTDPRVRADASPLTHVHRGLPPFLILSAEHDLPTLPDMAKEFRTALVDAGCDARLLKMSNRNHNSIIFSAVNVEDPAGRAILEFVREHSKK